MYIILWIMYLYIHALYCIALHYITLHYICLYTDSSGSQPNGLIKAAVKKCLVFCRISKGAEIDG